MAAEGSRPMRYPAVPLPRLLGFILVLWGLGRTLAQQAGAASSLDVETAVQAALSGGRRNASVLLSADNSSAVTQFSLPSAFSLTVKGQGNRLRWSVSPSGIAFGAGSSLSIIGVTLLVDDDGLVQISNASVAGAMYVPALPSALLPTPPNANGSNSAAQHSLSLVNVTLKLSTCSASVLQQQQALACRQAATVGSAWTSPTVMPGSLVVRDWESSKLGIHLVNVTITCLEQPWNTIQNSTSLAIVNATMASQLPVPCIVHPVNSAEEMLLLMLTQQAFLKRQRSLFINGTDTGANSTALSAAAGALPGGPFVLLQLQQDISVSKDMWPVSGVELQANVTLLGPTADQAAAAGIEYSMLELSMGLVPILVFVSDPVIIGPDTPPVLSVRNLILSNAPLGPDSSFPTSMLVGALWAVRFNRPLANSLNRTVLAVNNAVLVIPHDLFDYLSYWAGIQISAIPNVASQAAWMASNLFYGMSVSNAQVHSLTFAHRLGQGTVWDDSSLTDIQHRAPMLMQSTGIQDIAPGAPYAALNLFEPAQTPRQLLNALLNTSQPYVVVLNDIKLTPACLAAAANSSLYAQQLLAIGPGNSSSGNNTVAISRPCTILGRSGMRPPVLDLGNLTSAMVLSLPAATRLTLYRVSLVELAPLPAGSASAAAQQLPLPVAGNLSSAVYAFNFPRRVTMLRLQNVTALVPCSEVAALTAALAAAASIPSSPPSPSPPPPPRSPFPPPPFFVGTSPPSLSSSGFQSPPAVIKSNATVLVPPPPSAAAAALPPAAALQALASLWGSYQARAGPVAGTLMLSDALYLGVEAADLVLTCSPALAGVTTDIFVPVDVDLSGPALSAAPPPGGSSSGGALLSAWQVAVIVVSVVIVTVAVTGSMFIVWWKAKGRLATFSDTSKAFSDTRSEPAVLNDLYQDPHYIIGSLQSVGGTQHFTAISVGGSLLQRGPDSHLTGYGTPGSNTKLSKRHSASLPGVLLQSHGGGLSSPSRQATGTSLTANGSTPSRQPTYGSGIGIPFMPSRGTVGTGGTGTGTGNTMTSTFGSTGGAGGSHLSAMGNGGVGLKELLNRPTDSSVTAGASVESQGTGGQGSRASPGHTTPSNPGQPYLSRHVTSASLSSSEDSHENDRRLAELLAISLSLANDRERAARGFGQESGIQEEPNEGAEGEGAAGQAVNGHARQRVVIAGQGTPASTWGGAQPPTGVHGDSCSHEDSEGVTATIEKSESTLPSKQSHKGDGSGSHQGRQQQGPASPNRAPGTSSNGRGSLATGAGGSDKSRLASGTNPTNGTNNTASSVSSASARKALPGPALEGGIASGNVGNTDPADLLRSIIEQKSGHAGIDMQQVTFDQVIGQGSFGVVYKGKWRSMTVAIKALMFQDAGSAKRIKQRAITEAAINTLLSHENIVNTYCYDLRPVDSNLPDHKHAAHWKLYIIQEFCDSGSLAQAIDRGMLLDPFSGQPNLAYILQIALDIARGMSYVQERNVIHGDLSSGNIMLRFDARSLSCYQAKVCDFGLSRFLEGPDQSHISNARQGTPFYIAPEVLMQGIISKDADVFSFGVLLWEMMSGRPPWRDKALLKSGAVLDPRSFQYTLPPVCPEPYAALVAACLQTSPKARPRFTDLLFALQDLMAVVHRQQRGGPGSGAVMQANGPRSGQVTHLVNGGHTGHTGVVTPAHVNGHGPMQQPGGGPRRAPSGIPAESLAAAAAAGTAAALQGPPRLPPLSRGASQQLQQQQQQHPLLNQVHAHPQQLAEVQLAAAGQGLASDAAALQQQEHHRGKFIAAVQGLQRLAAPANGGKAPSEQLHAAPAPVAPQPNGVGPKQDHSVVLPPPPALQPPGSQPQQPGMAAQPHVVMTPGLLGAPAVYTVKRQPLRQASDALPSAGANGIVPAVLRHASSQPPHAPVGAAQVPSQQQQQQQVPVAGALQGHPAAGGPQQPKEGQQQQQQQPGGGLQAQTAGRAPQQHHHHHQPPLHPVLAQALMPLAQTLGWQAPPAGNPALPLLQQPPQALLDSRPPAPAAAPNGVAMHQGVLPGATGPSGGAPATQPVAVPADGPFLLGALQQQQRQKQGNGGKDDGGRSSGAATVHGGFAPGTPSASPSPLLLAPDTASGPAIVMREPPTTYPPPQEHLGGGQPPAQPLLPLQLQQLLLGQPQTGAVLAPMQQPQQPAGQQPQQGQESLQQHPSVGHPQQAVTHPKQVPGAGPGNAVPSPPVWHPVLQNGGVSSPLQLAGMLNGPPAGGVQGTGFGPVLTMPIAAAARSPGAAANGGLLGVVAGQGGVHVLSPQQVLLSQQQQQPFLQQNGSSSTCAGFTDSDSLGPSTSQAGAGVAGTSAPSKSVLLDDDGSGHGGSNALRRIATAGAHTFPPEL